MQTEQRDAHTTMSGQLTFTIDEEIGIARVIGSGMRSPELTERHFRNLDRSLAHVRRRHGRARTLVDLREAAVQTAETAQIMKRWTSRIYQASDRAAVICATSLLAMQIRRAAQVRQLATFVDADEALRWLLTEETPATALTTAAR